MYTYECLDCDKRFSVPNIDGQDEPTYCPFCGSALQCEHGLWISDNECGYCASHEAAETAADWEMDERLMDRRDLK